MNMGGGKQMSHKNISMHGSSRGRVRRLHYIWTPQKTKQLIDVIKGKPGLWNHSTSAYTDRTRREQLWSEVSEEMHVPALEVKTKWNVLRCGFRASYIRNRCGKELNSIHKLLLFLVPFFDIDPSNRVNSERLYTMDSPMSASGTHEKVENMHESDTKLFSHHLNNYDHMNPSARTLVPAALMASMQEGEEIEFRTEINPEAWHATYGNDEKSISGTEKLRSARNRDTNDISQLSFGGDCSGDNPNSLDATNQDPELRMCDIWTDIGNFVASNGRQWATQNPRIARDFQTVLYRIIAKFQEKISDQTNYGNIMNMSN